MIRSFLFAIIIAVVACIQISAQRSSFVSVKNQTFQLNGNAFYFIGTNYWYGSLLGLEKDKKLDTELLVLLKPKQTPVPVVCADEIERVAVKLKGLVFDGYEGRALSAYLNASHDGDNDREEEGSDHPIDNQ